MDSKSNTSKPEEVTADILKQFMVDHYSTSDFSHWLKKIEYNARKLEQLKSDKGRRGYLLELYSAYLQLAEVLLTNINIATLREKRILTNLFLPTDKLREIIEKAIEDPTFIKWFLDNYDFGITEKNTINRYTQKYEEHEALLKEVIKDYLDDYQFLNAYKHGYRVKSRSTDHSFTFVASNGTSVNLDTYDSVLIYLSREKLKDGRGKFVIYEKSIALKIKRVVIKAMFITAVLDNIKEVLSAQGIEGKKIKVTHFFFQDKKIWNESFGSARIKKELFVIKG